MIVLVTYDFVSIWPCSYDFFLNCSHNFQQFTSMPLLLCPSITVLSKGNIVDNLQVNSISSPPTSVDWSCSSSLKPIWWFNGPFRAPCTAALCISLLFSGTNDACGALHPYTEQLQGTGFSHVLVLWFCVFLHYQPLYVTSCCFQQNFNSSNSLLLIHRAQCACILCLNFKVSRRI